MNPLLREIRQNPLLWLLAFVPTVFIVEHLRPEAGTLIFVLSVLGIVPLAVLLSRATESVAAKTGDTVGGFLNATLGNLTELVITLSALRAGQYMLVKASIAGAIVTNVLFMLGFCRIVVAAAAGSLPAKVVDDRVPAGPRDEAGDVAVLLAAQDQAPVLDPMHQVERLRGDEVFEILARQRSEGADLRAGEAGECRGKQEPQFPAGVRPRGVFERECQLLGEQEHALRPGLARRHHGEVGTPYWSFVDAGTRRATRDELLHPEPDERCVCEACWSRHAARTSLTTSRDGSWRTRPRVGLHHGVFDIGRQTASAPSFPPYSSGFSRRRNRPLAACRTPLGAMLPTPFSCNYARGGDDLTYERNKKAAPAWAGAAVPARMRCAARYRVTTIRRVSAALTVVPSRAWSRAK